MIILNKQYLSEWLNMSFKSLRVYFGNQLITDILVLTKEVQLSVIFGSEFAKFDGFTPHNYLTKKAHILHNILTQMISPRIG